MTSRQWLPFSYTVRARVDIRLLMARSSMDVILLFRPHLDSSRVVSRAPSQWGQSTIMLAYLTRKTHAEVARITRS
jgi:hypothetical protein